ncbi:hypothetical protein Patl1_18796 [Pistacia atlantica]|uniref:Uncharacterized protein n=1 Tax=Pistacia atlantica TaxID=434234 RepID=A0ACC1BYH9_9ROSI|nr:hypothetical protein Patl1_18796 [Pistacia atlantica]
MVAKNEAEPDEFTYSFLLSACAKKSLFREGEQVHGRVLANGYCSNVFVKTNLVNLYAMKGGDSGVVEARYLVLLANVYATTKRWHDVAAVRQKMIEMGVRKPPGRSRVQINGVVHDFVAGDSTHKHASLIYKMLDEITGQSMWEGYKLDVSELFSVVEE